MKKFFVLALLLLMIITMVGCTKTETATESENSTITTEPQKITLTTSNISSYLGIEVVDDSKVFIGDYIYNDKYDSDVHFLLRDTSSGWLRGSFEVSAFPKKAGYFENVRIGFKYEADSWEFLSEPDNKVAFTLSFDEKQTKNVDIFELVHCDGQGDPTPPIKVKITYVNGSFIPQ